MQSDSENKGPNAVTLPLLIDGIFSLEVTICISSEMCWGDNEALT